MNKIILYTFLLFSLLSSQSAKYYSDTFANVVKKVNAGQEVTGWIMETDKTEKLKALAEIPLGHKLALTDIKNGETICSCCYYQ